MFQQCLSLCPVFPLKDCNGLLFISELIVDNVVIVVSGAFWHAKYYVVSLISIQHLVVVFQTILV